MFVDLEFIDCEIQSGEVQSPNFPDKYDNKVNRTEVIEVMEGNRILLTFTHFETESGYDYVYGKDLIKTINISILYLS